MGDHAYAGDASGGRVYLRAAGRSVRAADPAHDRHCLLFPHGVAHRFRAQFHDVPDLSSALRNRHGRRVGAGRIVGDGKFAHRSARIVFRNSATGLRVRLPVGRGCLLAGVSVLRLARLVRGWSAAGFSGDFHPRARAGIACLATPPQPRRFLGQSMDHSEKPLGALSLCDLVDDRVQRHVSRDARHVSNFSGRTARSRSDAKGEHRNHIQCRRDLWRHDHRSFLAEVWSASLHHSCCGPWDSPHSSLGFSAESLSSRNRRIRHAIHGARRMGDRAGALK